MLELNGKTYEVPEWIVRKNLSYAEAAAWRSEADTYMERETEKAVLAARKTDYGIVRVWCPKSVLVSAVEAARQFAERQERMDQNMRYGAYLKSLAADNGVKLGNMSNWEKIIAKLEKHGVKAMSRQEFAA